MSSTQRSRIAMVSPAIIAGLCCLLFGFAVGAQAEFGNGHDLAHDGRVLLPISIATVLLGSALIAVGAWSFRRPHPARRFLGAADLLLLSIGLAYLLSPFEEPLAVRLLVAGTLIGGAGASLWMLRLSA